MTRTRIFLAVIALILADSTSSAGGPKSKGYPFQLPPEKAITAVEKLEKVSKKTVALTDDERKFFADARSGTVSFGESCLVASGVTDAAKRKGYLARLEAIEKDARKAIEGAKTPAEKAEKLLKFLHAGPMKGGYASKQTDLDTLLDTGKFNCVSSAVLFNIIGRRLDLDLVAVEVPQHVFSLLRDSDQRIDVETTSPRGLEVNTLKTPKGKAPKDRYAGHRREVDELGLASVIAYNHGVGLMEEKRFHEALMANFRALSLDPNNPGAVQNALAAFTNWTQALTHADKYEEALAVNAAARQLCPKESRLQNNTKAIYDSWANSYMKKDEWAKAVGVYEKGLTEMPGDSHLKNNLAYCKEKQARK